MSEKATYTIMHVFTCIYSRLYQKVCKHAKHMQIAQGCSKTEVHKFLKRHLIHHLIQFATEPSLIDLFLILAMYTMSAHHDVVYNDMIGNLHVTI